MSNKFANTLHKYEAQYKLPPGLLGAVMRQESGGNPNARSPVGAAGLFQLMPSTAKALGVTNVFDPEQSIMGGAKYLRQQLDRFNGRIPMALAAYNAGPGAVQKYNGIPPYKETQNYVRSIMGMMKSAPKVNAAYSYQPTNQPTRPSGPTVPDVSSDERVAAWGDKIEFAPTPTPPQQTKTQPSQVDNPFLPGGKFNGSLFNYLGNTFGLSKSSSDHDAKGVHVNGSYHYRANPFGGVDAYDYGDAKNNPAKLKQTMNFLKQHPDGVSEAFYDPMGFYIKDGKVYQGSIGGHGDHLHVAWSGNNPFVLN